MRYKTKEGELKYVYTLNNTVLASPRFLACFMENYQTEDGSINIPQVLQPYMGMEKISRKG
jgi:seryl-tRNA synthetase